MSVFELAAGVFIGVMLAAVCLLSLKAADKKEDFTFCYTNESQLIKLPAFCKFCVASSALHIA